MDYSKLYIDGQWVKPLSGKYMDVENPADQSVITQVPRSGEKDVEEAITAAKKALKTWSKTDPKDRETFVRKLIKALIDDFDELEEIVASELGCPRDFARSRHLEAYIEGMEGFLKDHSQLKYREKHDQFTIFREPVGIVACLTPWNYPFGQIVKKVIPALLTGNTVILKPSKSTPLTAYYWAKAAETVELPAGVFNLVPGRGGEVGNVLAKHKDVNMISFTGSTSGGKEVGELGLSTTVKRLALELGGKSPSIILKGANLDLAIKYTLSTVYENVGQTCSAKTRLFIPKELESEIYDKIKEITKEFVFGDPREDGVDVGVLNSQAQFDKVKHYIELGLEEGAELLIGEVPKEGNGYYVGPTVFINVNNDMRIAQEEIFGPVLSVITYDTIEEAIDMANDSIYGLSGFVFGPEEEAMEVARQIKAGQVQVNDGIYTHRAPFGGFKQSGVGREGGLEGILEFVEVQTIFHKE